MSRLLRISLVFSLFIGLSTSAMEYEYTSLKNNEKEEEEKIDTDAEIKEELFVTHILPVLAKEYSENNDFFGPCTKYIDSSTNTVLDKNFWAVAARRYKKKTNFEKIKINGCRYPLFLCITSNGNLIVPTDNGTRVVIHYAWISYGDTTSSVPTEFGPIILIPCLQSAFLQEKRKLIQSRISIQTCKQLKSYVGAQDEWDLHDLINDLDNYIQLTKNTYTNMPDYNFYKTIAYIKDVQQSYPKEEAYNRNATLLRNMTNKYKHLFQKYTDDINNSHRSKKQKIN